jgi:hypothetical protein
MSTARTTKGGGCECGAVRFEVTGPMRKVVYCHCGQCRRTSGHFVAATACATEHLQFVSQAGLRWYRSSDIAERGFCQTCGSSIFYRPNHGKHISIMAGTLDTPTGLRGREHIHVDAASDYYAITDGLPQYAGDHDDLWEDNDA